MRPGVKLLAFAAFLFLAAVCCTLAWSQVSPEQPKAFVYLSWDPEFLYIAAKVEDPNVVGTNTGAMSEVWQDDSADFYFDVGASGGDTVGRSCARLAISAAGGFAAFTGSPGGGWKAAPEWMKGLRFDASVEGTLNNPRDKDRGYVVEAAVPWKLLGGGPTRTIGFNAVCHLRGEQEGFASWSAGVKSEEDFDRPSRWGLMEVSLSTAPSRAESGKVVCPRSRVAPRIDGKLGVAEWMAASVIEIEKAAAAAAPSGAPVPPTPTRTGRREIEQIAAIYRYDYGAGQAAEIFSDQPQTGVGPWMSYRLASWHASQVNDARRAGIGTLLVRCGLDEASLASWGRKGLICLVQALREMGAQAGRTPSLGLYIDGDLASSLLDEGQRGKAQIANAVCEFFRFVPRDMRAALLGGSDALGYLVVVGPPVRATPRGSGQGGPEGAPGSEQRPQADFTDVCEDAFAHEFPESHIAWVLDPAWKSSREPAGWCPIRGSGSSFDSSGRVACASISPGTESGGPVSIHGRGDGKRYEREWETLLAQGPQLIILNSLNDYRRGTEIASSRQYGVQFIDITKRFTAEAQTSSPSGLAFLSHSLPKVMKPGAVYQVDFLLENLSGSKIDTGGQEFIQYRFWRRGSARGASSERPPEGWSPGRARISHAEAFSERVREGVTLLPGEAKYVTLALRAGSRDKPLDPGPYSLAVELARSKVPLLTSRWFRQTMASETFKVEVGSPPRMKATFLRTSTPPIWQSGEKREVILRLRNDGEQTWKKGSAGLSYRWARVSNGQRQMVDSKGARTEIGRSVEPGQIVAIRALVSADAGGTPLEPWSASAPSVNPAKSFDYELLWSLEEGRPGSSSSAAEYYAEAVQVVGWSCGMRVVRQEIPGEMEAGKEQRVSAVLLNDGKDNWRRGEAFLAARWYDRDGIEAESQALRLPIEADTPPGQTVTVEGKVRAPDVCGGYFLCLDMVFKDGRSALASDEAGRPDFVPYPIKVVGGRFSPIDLGGKTNVIAATASWTRAVGNFDGMGRSFPSEHIPPDLSAPPDGCYPCGYYLHQRCEPRVPFLFPQPREGRGGAVAAMGQTLEIEAVEAEGVHLAIASATDEQEADFALIYEDGSQEVKVISVPSWLQAPGEPAVFSAPYVHRSPADEDMTVYVHHRVLKAAPGKKLKGLRLPNSPAVRVFALTVERKQ